jgi:UDP-N-acetylmuramoylalanine--D-glutamate ligase
MDSAFLKHRKVLIMGLGRFGGGADSAAFAASRGAKVVVTDLAGAEQLTGSMIQLKKYPDIEYHLAGHNEKDFQQADVVIVNPAVSDENKYVQIARKNNAIVTSQISIFFDLCPAKIIGVTGSNGKSTTAALTAHLLKAHTEAERCKYGSVWLSGNIGNEPLLMQIDQIKLDDLVVLELSSFQIGQLARYKKAPQVALITNLLPNHLDRYGTFDNYCKAKESIFRFQELDESTPAVSIFNAEDNLVMQWYERYKKDTHRICKKFSSRDVDDNLRSRFTLPGKANLSNLAAALAVARCFDVDDESIECCLGSFRPLPHRLELISDIGGVRWYNDSKATTPESTIAALEAFEEPIILIAGGYDKSLSFDELGVEIANKVKKAILIGQTANKIKDSISLAVKLSNKSGPILELADSLNQAVNSAAKDAHSGDVVVLSPACASYDMFDNYQQRGQRFRQLVRRLVN